MCVWTSERASDRAIWSRESSLPCVLLGTRKDHQRQTERKRDRETIFECVISFSIWTWRCSRCSSCVITFIPFGCYARFQFEYFSPEHWVEPRDYVYCMFRYLCMKQLAMCARSLPLSLSPALPLFLSICICAVRLQPNTFHNNSSSFWTFVWCVFFATPLFDNVAVFLHRFDLVVLLHIT